MQNLKRNPQLLYVIRHGLFAFLSLKFKLTKITASKVSPLLCLLNKQKQWKNSIFLVLFDIFLRVKTKSCPCTLLLQLTSGLIVIPEPIARTRFGPAVVDTCFHNLKVLSDGKAH